MPFVKVTFQDKDEPRAVSLLAEGGQLVICRPGNEVIVSLEQLKKLRGTGIRVFVPTREESQSLKELDLNVLCVE